MCILKSRNICILILVITNMKIIVSLCIFFSVLGVTIWLNRVYHTFNGENKKVSSLRKNKIFSNKKDGLYQLKVNRDTGKVFNRNKGNTKYVEELKTNQPTLSVATIDASSNISEIEQFWKSTGFCPPEPHQKDSTWFLSKDMNQNLAYMAAIPFDGLKQVRIHWLLDSVKISSFHHGHPVYDFSKLDLLMQRLWSNGLKPGFEVMGNPSNYFTDFENITQIQLWRDLITEMVQRYQDQFGVEYVSQWNFETWNEPRSNHFDGLNFTLKGFFNYYDATRDALKTVNDNIAFGGPGGECHDYDPKSFCWSLLNHTLHGTNILSKKTPPGIDYISIHKKGEEPNNSDVIFEKEKDFYLQLQKYLPGLSNTPIFNDEGDPLVGWNKEKWWRADVTYAAMAAKVIVEHQNRWLSRRDNRFNLKLFSNDNGFLSYNPHFFTQRTLLARFQMNNTKPAHVQFIRKPIYSVMGLLSYLGETQLKANLDTMSSNELGLIASFHKGNELTSSDSKQISVLIYNSADTREIRSETNVSLNFNNMTGFKEFGMVAYRLDLDYTNPYKVWQMEGKPNTPTLEILRKMRDQEEPLRILEPGAVSLLGNAFQLNITVPLPGVALVHLCQKATLPPDQVTDVTIQNITSGQILIVWSDGCVHSKCIKTYEVEHSPHSTPEKFTRINSKDIIFNIFVFTASIKCVYIDLSASDVYGSYRVRAVDYWNRPGEYSLPVNYP